MKPFASETTRRELFTVAAALGTGAAAFPLFAETLADGEALAQSQPSDEDLVERLNQVAAWYFPDDARRQDAFLIRAVAAVRGAAGSAQATRFSRSPKASERLRIEQYSKAIRRDPATPDDPGLPEIQAFNRLRIALDDAYERTWTRAGFPDAPDFANIETLQGDIAGAQRLQLTNPLGGLSFDLEGYDPPATFIPAAPEFGSQQAAAEMAEVYWLALLRDTDFEALEAGSQNDGVRDAIDDLNKFAWYGAGGVGPISGVERFGRADLRTPADTGRLGFEGVELGPYVSQFLFRGTRDPVVGRSPGAGFVSFGSLRVNQRQRTVLGSADGRSVAFDYLFVPESNAQMRAYLDVQGGSRAAIGTDQFDKVQRFLRTLRDGANYVHFDKIYQQYLIAACILIAEVPRTGPTLTEPMNNRSADPGGALAEGAVLSNGMVIAESTGPAPDLLNPGNPYRSPVAAPQTVQGGFATFGLTQIVTMLAETSTRAHKAGWYHKWSQRRLRPEEFGGRVHYELQARRRLNYGIDAQLLDSADPKSGDPVVLKRIKERYGSYLLPMAFPEGSPTHPAYPSGHATVAGASVTMLKAAFNETMTWADYFGENAVIYRASRSNDDDKDGTRLEAIPAATYDPRRLTIRGELNKLASNITMFRCMAGVHWRSDEIQGLLLGEQIAMSILMDATTPAWAVRDRDTERQLAIRTRFYREHHRQQDIGDQPFFRFTTFAGIPVHIQDGKLFAVEEANPANLFDWKIGEELSLSDFAAEVSR